MLDYHIKKSLKPQGSNKIYTAAVTTCYNCSVDYNCISLYLMVTVRRCSIYNPGI